MKFIAMLLSTAWMVCLVFPDPTRAGTDTGRFDVGARDFNIGTSFTSLLGDGKEDPVLMHLGTQMYVMKNLSLGGEFVFSYDLPFLFMGDIIIGALENSGDDSNSSGQRTSASKKEEDQLFIESAHAVGANFRASWRVLRWDPCSVFVDGTIGALTTSERFPDPSGAFTTGIASLGMSAAVKMVENVYLNIGARYEWMEGQSGGRHSDNRGVMAYVGLTYKF